MIVSLTTHVGSLPRPDDICDLLRAKVEGQPPAAGDFDKAVALGVDAVVARQKAAGIDIVSDGEFSKLGYANYITDRLTGFEGDSPRVPGADLAEFPAYAQKLGERRKGALFRCRVPAAPGRSRSRIGSRSRTTSDAFEAPSASMHRPVPS